MYWWRASGRLYFQNTPLIFTSKDKYDFMVKEQPLLQKLKDKLGLDFE